MRRRLLGFLGTSCFGLIAGFIGFESFSIGWASIQHGKTGYFFMLTGLVMMVLALIIIIFISTAPATVEQQMADEGMPSIASQEIPLRPLVIQMIIILALSFKVMLTGWERVGQSGLWSWNGLRGVLDLLCPLILITVVVIVNREFRLKRPKP